MKKIILITIMATTSTVFFSCSKKDFVCTCTDVSGSTSTTEYKGVLEEDALSACNIIQSPTTTCTLSEN